MYTKIFWERNVIMSANKENGLEGKWVTSNMAKYWQLGDPKKKKQHLLYKLTIPEPKCLGSKVSHALDSSNFELFTCIYKISWGWKPNINTLFMYIACMCLNEIIIKDAMPLLF